MATTLRRAIRGLQHPWLIVGVALCLRAAWMVAYAPWNAPNERLIARAPNPDAGSYQEVALVLMRYWNKPEQAIVEMPEAIDSIIIRAPGYSLVMAVLYALLGVNPAWVVVAQVCASVLTCALAIAALRRISTPLGASIGGWLVALNPTLIDYTQLILTETLFVLGVALVLYAFAQFRAQPNPAVMRTGLGIGVALALTTLIRPSPLWLIPVLGVLGVFVRPLSTRSRGLWLVGYLAGVLALFAPWAAYNRVHYGSWRLTLAGELYLLDMTGLAVTQMQQPIHQARAVLEAEAFARMRRDGLDPDRQIFERGRYYRAVALDYIRRHPNEFAYYWLRGMLFFWRSAGGPNTGNEWILSSRAVRLWFQGYYFAYLIALGAGLWLALQARRQRWWAVLFVLTAFILRSARVAAGTRDFGCRLLSSRCP